MQVRLLAAIAIALMSMQQPETLSLLEQPLYPPPVPKAERARLEAEIAAGRQAVARDPSNADEALKLSRAQFALGRVGDAMETLTRATERSKDDPRLRLERGRGFLMIRKFGHAERDFEKAAQTLPGANCDIGLAIYLQGDFKRAANAFGKCPDGGFFGYLTARRNGVTPPVKPAPPPDRSPPSPDIRLPGTVASKAPKASFTIGERYLEAVERIVEGQTKAAMDLLKPLVENNMKAWMEPAYIAAEADYARLLKAEPRRKKR